MILNLLPSLILFSGCNKYWTGSGSKFKVQLQILRAILKYQSTFYRGVGWGL